jgi:translation initiation factor IF-1
MCINQKSVNLAAMTGVVYKSTGSWYHVKDAQGKLIPCRIKGKFRIEGLTSTNPVAVGDVVEVTIKDTQDGWKASLPTFKHARIISCASL